MTSLGEHTAPSRPKGHIDPRGPRFAATITAVLLLIGIFLALIGTSTSGVIGSTSLGERVADPGFILLLIVAALFAWSLLSPATQPWSVLFRTLVQPKLPAPSEWEDPRPPRFAQAVGLVVVGIGLLLHLFAVPWALVIAAAAAFIAAALNAAIGFCLGCEIYLLLARVGVIRAKPLSEA